MTENSRDGDNDDSKDDYDIYGGGFDDNNDKNDQNTNIMIFQPKIRFLIILALEQENTHFLTMLALLLVSDKCCKIAHCR